MSGNERPAAGVAAVSPSEPRRRKRLPKALPKVIYLQWFGSGEFDPDADISENDVTWCRDKTFDADYRYVLAAAPAAPPEPTPVGARPHFRERVDHFVTYGPDSDNGAGLNAVFVGSMPVHHFRKYLPEPTVYLEKLRKEIAAFAVGERCAAVADSRAPAEVLEALRIRVEVIVLNWLGTPYDLAKRIAREFDAAVKEPTKCTR